MELLKEDHLNLQEDVLILHVGDPHRQGDAQDLLGDGLGRLGDGLGRLGDGLGLQGDALGRLRDVQDLQEKDRNLLGENVIQDRHGDAHGHQGDDQDHHGNVQGRHGNVQSHHGNDQSHHGNDQGPVQEKGITCNFILTTPPTLCTIILHLILDINIIVYKTERFKK